MTTFLKATAAAGLALLLGACANTDGPDLDTTASRDTTTGRAPTGPIPGSEADFRQNAGHQVFYDYDEYTLSPRAQQTLARQAAWLQEYPETRIKIAGNCDERGTREYNLALGARRANAARAYLVSLGVDGNRITTVSYGKERPSCTASNEQCWAQNRNATTTIESVAS